MENENIPPISYGILYGSQGEGFLTPTWLMIDMKMFVRNYKEFIRIYNDLLMIHYPE